MSHDSKSARKIKRHNIKKAIKLIKKSNIEKENHKKASNNKIALYCNNGIQNTKRKRQMTSVVGFSKSLTLSEMRIYIAHQDWKHALKLFLRLFEYSVEVEPLVWKYAFIILSHMNDSSHLHEFLKQCAGAYTSSSILLKRLLLLPLQEND